MLIAANTDMQIYLITKWISLRFAMRRRSESSVFVLGDVERGLQNSRPPVKAGG